jgi:L-alanine-DL-glutamate epimerase-like enolase superfamily enzyme
LPNITVRHIQVTKLYPLAISRGTSTGSRNLFVLAEQDGLVGIGECAPGTGFDETLAGIAERQIGELCSAGLEGRSIFEIWSQAREMGMDSSALAALDIALWDLLAKRAGLPLYQLLGLCKPHVPTSVTIGINPPDVIRERVPDILRRSGGRCLKIKLGSPEGIGADKDNFLAAKQASDPFHVKLRVDANGGWSVDDAKHMISWLADNGADYVEQPLPEGAEDDLPRLYEGRRIPIFVDESCRWSKDVPKVSGAVDGVNMKLMKCGGISEALRIVATARAHGLKTMIGCMGESSIAIAAGAALGGLLDHIDLDSHFNLNPDPADGLEMIDGVVTPRDVPGHGGFLKDA